MYLPFEYKDYLPRYRIPIIMIKLSYHYNGDYNICKAAFLYWNSPRLVVLTTKVILNLQLVEQAIYLGLLVRNDLSWDNHILELCRKMYYYVHMFRRLRKTLPSQLLLNILKSYVEMDSYQFIWQEKL